MTGVRRMIEVSIATILTVASWIVAVGAAIKVLVDAKKVFKKPFDDIEARLQHHDECLARDKQKLEKMDYTLQNVVESNKMLIKSNMVMLKHMEEGNHNGEIKAQEEKLNDWLVERGVS